MQDENNCRWEGTRAGSSLNCSPPCLHCVEYSEPSRAWWLQMANAKLAILADNLGVCVCVKWENVYKHIV